MVDGDAGTELLTEILDSERDPKLPPLDIPTLGIRSVTLGAELAVQALTRRRSVRMSSTRVPLHGALTGRAARTAAATVRGLSSMAALLRRRRPRR